MEHHHDRPFLPAVTAWRDMDEVPSLNPFHRDREKLGAGSHVLDRRFLLGNGRSRAASARECETYQTRRNVSAR
jgi:hypothetical protein